MEEESDYETEKFEFIVAPASNLTRKQKLRGKVNNPGFMECWKSAVLQGDSERLRFESKGWVQRHAHWRGQPGRLLAAPSVRLPPLTSTTISLYPAETILDRSVHGGQRFTAKFRSPLNSREEAPMNRVGPHRHKMSLTFEENELRRRIEEEKRKQRELQRCFHLFEICICICMQSDYVTEIFVILGVQGRLFSFFIHFSLTVDYH